MTALYIILGLLTLIALIAFVLCLNANAKRESEIHRHEANCMRLK